MSEDLDASGRRDARRLGDIRDRGLARRHRDRRRRTRTAERLIDGRNGFFRGLVCFGHLRGSWRSAYGGVSGGQRVRRAPVERTPAPRHARAIAISAVHSSAALATIGLLKIFPTVWRKDAPCAMTAKRKVESQFRICPNSEFGAEWAAPAMRPNFCDSYSFTLSPSHHVALRIFVSYSFQRSVQCGVVHGARGVCSACILRATCGTPATRPSRFTQIPAPWPPFSQLPSLCVVFFSSQSRTRNSSNASVSAETPREQPRLVQAQRGGQYDHFLGAPLQAHYECICTGVSPTKEAQ